MWNVEIAFSLEKLIIIGFTAFSFYFEDSYYGESQPLTLLVQISLVLQCKPTFAVKGFPDTRRY